MRIYYIEQQGKNITSKGYIDTENKQIQLNRGQTQVTEEEYNDIVLYQPLQKMQNEPKSEIELLKEQIKSTQAAVDFILTKY